MDLNIRLSEIERDRPGFGKERYRPDVLSAIIDGKESVIDIAVQRDNWKDHIGRRVDLRTSDLGLREREYLCRELFSGNQELKDGQQIHFNYQIMPNTHHRSYTGVPEKDRARLEEKIGITHNWELAFRAHRRGLKSMGLEVEYSDEDIAVLPFIVIPGTTDSMGTVAMSFPTNGDFSYLGPTVDVVKPEYFDGLRRLYDRIRKKYGLNVELRLVEEAPAVEARR